MKRFLLFIFLVISLNSIAQCGSYSIAASYTPATCTTCCNGVITSSIVGPGVPCAPISCPTLQPTGLVSCTGTWNNLCAGSYTITGMDGCCMMSCQVVIGVSPTNINEKQNVKFGFELYPQPTKDIVIINLINSFNKNTEVKIFDITGKEIEKKELEVSQSKTQFSTLHLPNGIYILQLKNSQGQVAVKRLVVSK